MKKISSLFSEVAAAKAHIDTYENIFKCFEVVADVVTDNVRIQQKFLASTQDRYKRLQALFDKSDKRNQLR